MLGFRKEDRTRDRQSINTSTPGFEKLSTALYLHSKLDVQNQVHTFMYLQVHRNSLERELARQGFVALKEYLSVRMCWKKIPKEILEIRPVRNSNCTFLLLFDAPKGMLGCWLGHY